MKKLLLLLIPFVALLGFIPYSNYNSSKSIDVAPSDSSRLEPKPHYSEEIKLVTQILGTYHFKKIQLNDSLSSVILDEFISTLDNNKSYFLKSDIEDFEKHRYKIDEYSQEGVLDHAYDIYDVFRIRFEERMAYIQEVLLYKDFDYTLDEYYNTDRDEAAWPASKEDLNDLWRKLIKSQALSLKLNGKEDGIEETIKKRYERFCKSYKSVHIRRCI